MSSHATYRRSLKRLALGVAAVIVALSLAIVALWIFTPPAADISDRVAAQVQMDHGALLHHGDVPPLLAQALVAAEDERFYQHHGLDVIGIGRAIVDDLKSRCLCEGGSTITQQLVKRVYLGGSDRGINKVVGMVLAVKVETVLDKQAIMAAYISDIPMGPNIYGAEPSSCRYFRKPLKQRSCTVRNARRHAAGPVRIRSPDQPYRGACPPSRSPCADGLQRLHQSQTGGCG
jgi:membrane peptidoglycan carboxypeptidase